MDFPRQPLPTKITITGEHGDDVYRTALCIKAALDNHYASTAKQVINPTTIEITTYPFAVND